MHDAGAAYDREGQEATSAPAFFTSDGNPVGGEAAPQPHLGHVRLDDRADDDELRHEKGDEALPQALPLDDAELAEDGEHEEPKRKIAPATAITETLPF